MAASAHSPDWEAEADRLAAVAVAAGRPTEWFDQLYSAAKAGTVAAPWSRTAPNALLAGWLGNRTGAGRSAVVVGCGFGADAEFLQSKGFDVSAFDVSPTAVELTRERYPDSAVAYRAADLFDLPDEWERAFDLVVEIYTVQALPVSERSRAIAAVSSLVAANGTLFVVQMIRTGPADEAFISGPPPWMVSRDELDLFGRSLEEVKIEAVEREPAPACWRAEFRRPA